VKNWIANWLSFEDRSKKWLPFPETQVRQVVWSEKGSSDPRCDAKSDANCIQSEAERMPDGVNNRLKRPRYLITVGVHWQSNRGHCSRWVLYLGHGRKDPTIHHLGHTSHLVPDNKYTQIFFLLIHHHDTTVCLQQEHIDYGAATCGQHNENSTSAR